MATPSLAQPATPPQTETPLRPWRLASLWHLIGLWHLTSLDAPTVAVTWTLAFAWATQIHLPFWVPAAIALAAWSAYIADRLLDAHRALQPLHLHSKGNSCSLIAIPYSLCLPLRPRHHFHWRHRRLFLPIALTTAFAALLLVLIDMPPAARTRNSLLAAATLAYFTSVHNPWRLPTPKIKIPKELLVALIFTLTCALPTWARIPTGRLILLIPTLTFIALAWLNCHAIETWEATTRRRGTIEPIGPILPLASSLAALALLTAPFLAEHHPRIAILEAAAAVSAALIALLDLQQHRLTATTLRAATDLVLLTPLALLIMPVFTQ